MYKTLVILGAASILNAATTYVSTITGTRVVTGYFNETNSVSVIITLDGDDVDGGSADKSEQYIELYVGFSSSATVSTIDKQMSGLSSNPIAVAKTGSDNTHTFTVSRAALDEAYGASSNGKYFDFTVTFSGASSTHKAVTPSDGGTAHKYDTDDPYLSSYTSSSYGYPEYSYTYFKDQKVIYYPDETLFQTPSTYQSYVKFLGDTNGSGADNGNSHILNFSGSQLNSGSTITVNPITFSSGGDLVDGSGYDVSFYLYDVAGNYRSSTNFYNKIYDKTAPRISSATSGTSNATHKKGAEVSVTLNFSEAVYTSGVMNVVFTMDGDDYTLEVASFASRSSPVTSKTITYTVQDGNVTSDLTIGSIAMASGAYCYDAATNPMTNFAFTGNNLAANANHNIDGQPPTITIVSSDKADGTYGVGTEINVATTFSEAVTLSGGNFVITLETGNPDRDVTISSISSASTTSGTYTVQSGDVTSDLAATTNAATTGTISDAAGNAMESFAIASNFPSKAIVIETTAPTITNVTSSTGNDTYGVGDAINVTVTFSEDVTLSGSGAVFKIPLETGSTNTDYEVEVSTISSAGTASGTYTVRANDTSGGSDLTVKTDPGLSTTGTMKDDAGNTLSVFSIPDGQNLADLKNIKIDAVYPTITSITTTAEDGTYIIGDVLSLKATYSEDVTLSGGTFDITLNNANSSNNTVSITAFSSASEATKNYTVAEGDTSNDLSQETLGLSAGTLVDAGGNSIQVWTPTTSLGDNRQVKIDGNKPTILKISSTKSAGYYKVGDVIDVVLYFTEAVKSSAANVVKATLETGSSNTDYSLSYGSIDNVTYISGNYTVRTNDYNTDLTVNSVAISGGTVKDQNGLGNSMTVTTIPSGKNLADQVNGIFVDGVLPSQPGGTNITMVAKGGNEVSGKFNDTNTSVEVTVPLDSDDSSLTGGSIQVLAKIPSNSYANIGSAYTITSANVTAGTATVTLTEANIEGLTGFATDGVINFDATVSDIAGNAGDWSESSNTLTIDVTRPTITSATSTTDAGLYNTADAINTTLGFSEAVTLSGGDLTITLNTTGTSTVAEADLSSASTASTTYTVSSGEATADKTPAMLTVSNVNVTAGELKDGAGNPMGFPVTSIASNIADIKTIEVDGIDPTKMAIQSVKTVADTIRAGYWNEDNTSVKVRVGLDKNDASLAGGTIQITAQISGSYESIGTAGTIIQDSVAIEYQTIEVANTISGGTKGLEELTNWAELSTVNFKTTVTDKAGNSTGYDAASTTLIIDQTDPSTFTTDSVLTVTDEVVYGYWNEDNTAINVQVSIANDATLVNGTVQVQAEADGTFEFIGAGSLNSTATAISSADLGTEKTITINGASTSATIKELEEMTGFSEGDVLTFRAIIVDVAGNSRVGSVSSTEITVDQTDPGTPVVDLKSTSDSGIADWDNLTKDDTLAITLTNLTNTDSVFLKIATTAVALAQQDAIDVRDKTTSTEKDLIATSHANGTYLVSAKAKDKAGNWGADATAITVRIDTIPPDIPKAPDMLVSDDSGLSDSDNITSNLRPHFIMNGLSSALDSLRLVIDGGSSIGRDSIMSQAATDTFRVSSDLANGYHTAGIIAIDSAGNVQATSAVLAFVIDNVAPSKPDAPDLISSSDTGESATDNLTNDSTPSISSSNLESGSIMKLYSISSGAVTTQIAVNTVDTGKSEITLTPSTTISDDTYSFYTVSQDTAGNQVSSDKLDNVRIETVVPTASIVPADSLVRKDDSPLSISVTFNDGMATSPNIAVDFAGANDLAATNMANTTNDSIWTYALTIPDGNDGTATISISGTDNAGNTLTNANTTDRLILRVDNTDPVFTLLSPDSGEYVNHTKVGYKLSETVFSGSITWTRISGNVDTNSPHIVTLAASELDAATTFSKYTLINNPTTLVSGVGYSVAWSATDTAGNISADFISTPVYYDTTSPTAELTYSQYFATADSVVTITATFNERALPKPQIAINYQGEDRDVAATNMTMGADSTIWIYAAKIPGGSANNGLASISITATDLAGNSLRTADLTGSDTLVVDNTAPSVTLTYDDPDTLVRFEDAILLVTATFSDSIPVDSIPKISVNMPSGTNGDISAGGMTLVSGKVYNYSLPLVDKADGIIAITVSAYDKALNAIVADSIFRGSVVTIDNTDPSAFTTGTITAMGDTIVVPWLNKETDSLRLLIPISATDESLLDGGDVNVQMRVTGKMTTGTWVTIATSDASSPSAPADSIKQLSGNQTFFRKKEDIITSLKPLGLAQGDTIRIRGSINDKVGNITYGTQSESFFVLDTLPPAQRPFFGDTLFTSNNLTSILTVNRDTLWTNDTIRFAFNNWVDSVKTNEKASGINRYEYALYQSTKATPDETNPKDWTKFRDYRSLVLDTVRTDTFALTHNLKYYVALKAVDIAGNTSDTLNSFRTLRHNAPPVIDTIAAVVAKEDVLWDQLLTVNDKDLLIKDASNNVVKGTLRSDVFTYALTTMKLDTTAAPIDSAVVTNLTAAVSASGKVTFTPTKLDTADYVFRVIVTDNWTLKDTVDIDITAEAVNDPPIIDLSSIAKLTFLEGANSDSINLTRYSYDEDNDTTDLKYTFRIASTLPSKGGYPTAKVGFLSDFSREYKQSFISKLVDEFPLSTIIQKNNAFLIYPVNVDQFKDPIKVDSIAIGDSVFSWITPTDTASTDTNYYTSSDMMLEFTVTDPDGLTGKDTVTFFINPVNDPPVWSGVPDTIILENDSLYFDFANYLTDVDDSTLTISILPLTYGDNISIVPTKPYETKPTGIEYATNAHVDTVKFKPEALWFGPNGPWVKNKTDSTLIQITAADGDTSAIDTFVVKVQRVPRPEIRMYVVQNNAFTNYYEIFLVDSVGKTKDLTLKVQSKSVTLDTAAAFTYVGHYNFKTKGTYTFEVAANGIVGDTIITQNLGLALAKMYGGWSGRSADGQFNVIGRNGAVDFDQSIMILDSTLFEPYFNDRASYLLGNEAFRFKKSVEISMPGQDDEVALYQRSTGTGWIELPSITQGNRVMAYTEKMGYFRMGPKTLIVPGQTALQQNYPNPFNPITTIEYDLGFVDGPLQKVSLTVYDILGRNVRTLVNKQQGIGRYRLRWNGKDQNGVSVASGIYFVHLLTDMGRSQTKKVMLMR